MTERGISSKSAPWMNHPILGYFMEFYGCISSFDPYLAISKWFKRCWEPCKDSSNRPEASRHCFKNTSTRNASKGHPFCAPWLDCLLEDWVELAEQDLIPAKPLGFGIFLRGCVWLQWSKNKGTAVTVLFFHLLTLLVTYVLVKVVLQTHQDLNPESSRCMGRSSTPLSCLDPCDCLCTLSFSSIFTAAS